MNMEITFLDGPKVSFSKYIMQKGLVLLSQKTLQCKSVNLK